MKQGEQWELWFALVIGMIVVVMQHREKPWITRAAIAGVSGGIGYLMRDESFIPMLGPAAHVIIITAFSYLVLDIGFALFQDRQLVSKVARRLAGVKDE